MGVFGVEQKYTTIFGLWPYLQNHRAATSGVAGTLAAIAAKSFTNRRRFESTSKGFKLR
jgi:hypothetical protein